MATKNPENCIKAQVGERFLLKMLEDSSIGEIEFTEPQAWPTELNGEKRFHAKWWDGELTFGDYLVPVDRIVPYTPANLALAGKQVFKP